jgi:Tol biopolymer transport system component
MDMQVLTVQEKLLLLAISGQEGMTWKRYSKTVTQFRSSCTIFLVFFILFFSFLSCKKEKNDFVTPQNKILFTAKLSGVTNIVKLNTKTKTKQILSTTPFKLERPIFSPNKKKVVFQTRRGSNDSNLWDVYIMNLDGTELINLTKKLNILPKDAQYSKYHFTLDNQQILLGSYDHYDAKSSQILYLLSLDGTKIETITPDHPSHAYYICYFSNLNYKDEFVIDKDHLLLKNNNILGSFAWSPRTFTPIITFSEPITDYTLSPDKNYILYNVKKEKGNDAFIYDIQQKKTTKIVPLIEKEKVIVGSVNSVLWLNDGKSFIFNVTVIVEDTNKRSETKHFVYQFDVTTLKSEYVIETETEASRYLIFSGNIIVGHENWYDGPSTLIFFDYISKKLVNIPQPENRLQFANYIHILGENLFVFSMDGFFICNTKTKQISYSYLNENIDQNNLFGNPRSISNDQSKFYLVTKDKLILFDNKGKQILEELFTFDCYTQTYPELESTFLFGSFVSPSEIVYLEFGNNKADLFQYDQTTKKSKNLTDKLGKVKQIQVSPDQKQVAVLSFDEKEKKYSIDLIYLQTPVSPKRITSFSYPLKYSDAFRYYPDLSLLFSFSWSKNSQILYFVSSGPSQLQIDEKNATNSLVIYQFNAVGSKLKALTDINGLSFQPSLSSDGKQILYVSSEKQVTFLMNSDGTSKREVNSQEKMTNCIRPLWSVDGNYVSFYQNTGVYQKETNEIVYNFLVVNKKNGTNKSIPISRKNPISLIKFLKTDSYWSSDGAYVAYLKNLEVRIDMTTLVLLKDLKEEIPLKGNITDFRWSPSENQIILFETKEKDQNNLLAFLINEINQLTLYDCPTNSYTPISQDVQQIFDATWSLDGKQILYSGTDSKTGQIVFKTCQVNSSNQKVLFTFGENPLEQPSSMEKIEKLVWLQ